MGSAPEAEHTRYAAAYSHASPLLLQVRQLGKSIEDIRINVTSKRGAAALDDLKNVKKIINTKEAKLTASCREASVCSDILASMKDKLVPLEGNLKDSADSFRGSDQEREALDKSYQTQDLIQKELTILEEQMIPAGQCRSLVWRASFTYLIDSVLSFGLFLWWEFSKDTKPRCRGSMPTCRS